MPVTNLKPLIQHVRLPGRHTDPLVQRPDLGLGSQASVALRLRRRSFLLELKVGLLDGPQGCLLCLLLSHQLLGQACQLILTGPRVNITLLDLDPAT